MRTILNVLWNVPGLGFVAAFFWVLAGLLMAITIIGLPWAKACFTLANYTLAPFGRELVSRYDATGRQSLGTGGLGLLANVIWFLLAGWWLIVLHVVAACVSAITIIGIPFAWAHLKIAAAALMPVGKIVVPTEVAIEIDREKAAGWLYGTRRR
ncbi:MAG TPA: YccF domain-containing protein [Acetobacteraceae bacterium]|jgi:uncharacterized membrane protein YccF (DUF307 family)|nr:YccF domain-containing protein [Acetobacteraceae bacterium]